MDDALRANRDLWNAWTKINVESAFYDVASFRSGERGIRLSDYELAEVGPVEGKSLLHLQCHFGMDTLSWARLGAIVTGADVAFMVKFWLPALTGSEMAPKLRA